MAITEYADRDGLEGGLTKRPRRGDYGFDGNMIGLVVAALLRQWLRRGRSNSQDTSASQR